ncbi:MAG: cytochrome P450, partial [Pseudomonadota bacterium]
RRCISRLSRAHQTLGLTGTGAAEGRNTAMAPPPIIEIDPAAFWADPYPDLARMRAEAPVCFVPQLGSILFTRRDAIAECEKNVAVFSSDQPDGLMNKLMGKNMMRKDGDAHQAERKATFPAYSPRTVKEQWAARFEADAEALLADLKPKGEADLVRDYAMPLSGTALRAITGLERLKPSEIDWISQSMINGIANYSSEPEIEAECNRATAFVDAAIDARLEELREAPDRSLISVQALAGLPIETIRANVKLAISGGQNEPRDAIAGAIWALLTHPDQLALVRSGEVSWRQAFEEYARWVSPIGMSPRRVAQPHTWDGIDLNPEDRVFFMFGSANRDERIFEEPDLFDVTRDSSKHIAFGAGPHFCAGAAASRSLIAEVALPMIFEALPEMQIVQEPKIGGWAFRGLLDLEVRWNSA